MKKFIIILTTLCLLLSLVACGNKTADKYCTHCGTGMAKSDAFCPNCGTAFDSEVITTTSTDSSSNQTTKAAQTTKKKTTKPTPAVTTAKPTTTTTTAAPTTTTTTAAPTTTTTIHTHTYSKYVCTGCGKVDKTHPYEYLIEAVKAKGVADGTNIVVDVFGDGEYFLSYNAQDNTLHIRTSGPDNSGNFWFSALYLDSFFYGTTVSNSSGKIAEVKGTLDVASFTKNSPISYIEYTGGNSTKNSFIEVARSYLVVLVSVLDTIADQTEGLDIADLGFTSWQ